MSHQQVSYNQINGAKPCCYRGELELETRHHPETNCCKANTQVLSAKFFCKFYNKYLDHNTTLCWLCKERKETL